ncbi:tRNA lysidine(34) synthetase TilS [Candidatus Karelsulcia muelleri]|uniref:tRNA lysidine(34) synthetase TilS n=1 Tax=Candidatus Karelsulcia muelleri TaxID=336810 RepID=UPI000D7BB7EC|nr:tRNA lysidine(34) synthetase TilS [Candidatus Karelsulcia muelleri]
MFYKKKFLNCLKKHFILKNKKIYVAVSSGLDSMVMLDLLLKSCNNPIGVIHCNFNLRGDDSDKDEFFIQEFCLKNNLNFKSKNFNTSSIRRKTKFSIQMIARKLRYDWFKFLLNNSYCDYIALGHHLDDSIETFFINIIRGTGIKGLIGINNFKKNIIRPLFLFSKKEIRSYAKENNIHWREDISNNDFKYLRNKIRFFLKPILNYKFYNGFKKSIKYLSDEYICSSHHMDYISNYIRIEKKKCPFLVKIDLKKLIRLYPLSTYLFKIFYKYGFKNPKNLKNILNSKSGKKILSKKFCLIKDRTTFILVEKSFFLLKKIYYLHNLNTIKNPFFISFLISDKKKTNYSTYVDYEKLIFPLKIRNWEKGDKFNPIGLKGIKKLSKYFKDKKMSLVEKKNIWVLLNGDNKIIWIISDRLDQHFKVTNLTKKVLNINLHNFF